MLNLSISIMLDFVFSIVIKFRPMNLNDYFDTQETLVQFSKRTGISISSLSFWRHGIRRIPFERCPQIETATGGMVSRRDLCPDNWKELWPELAQQEQKKNEEAA